MPAKPTIEQLREIAQTYGMHCNAFFNMSIRVPSTIFQEVFQ
jgi:hypothetical protein